MILLPSQIEKLNRDLVNKTVNSNGKSGYTNRGDFETNSRLFSGLQLLDITKLLNDWFKYATTQMLGVDNIVVTPEVLNENYMHYSNQIKSYKGVTGLSFVELNVNGATVVELHYAYNPQIDKDILPYLKDYSTQKFYKNKYQELQHLRYDYYYEVKGIGIKILSDRLIEVTKERDYLLEISRRIVLPDMTFIYDEELTINTDYNITAINTNDLQDLFRMFNKLKVGSTPNETKGVKFNTKRIPDVIEALDKEPRFNKTGRACREKLLKAYDVYRLHSYEEMMFTGEFFLIETKTEEAAIQYKKLINKYNPTLNGNQSELDLHIDGTYQGDYLVRSNNDFFKKLMLGCEHSSTDRVHEIDNSTTIAMMRQANSLPEPKNTVLISKKKLIIAYKTALSLGYTLTDETILALKQKIGSDNVVVRKAGEKHKIPVIVTYRKVRFTYQDNTTLNSILLNLQSHKYDYDTGYHEVNVLELEELLQEVNRRNIQGSELNYLDFSDLTKALEDYKAMETKYREIKLFDYTRLSVKPFDYQIEGSEFLIRERGAILADEMGLGKTKTALVAARSVLDSPLLSKNVNRIAFIVCPSTVKLNWSKEILKVDPYDRIMVMIAGQKFDASKLFSNGRPIYKYIIINFDILERYSLEIMQLRPAVLIVDEAHKCTAVTNDGAPATIRAKQLVEMSEIVPFTWLLTGTPFRNKSIELFNLLTMINHDLALNFDEFARCFASGKRTKTGTIYKGFTNLDELNKRLNEKMIRRRKKDLKNTGNPLLDLPDKTRNFFPVEIDAKAYENAVDIFMANANIQSEYARMLVLMGAMKKYLAYAKIQHTYDIATAVLTEKDNEDLTPVVIFSDYKKPLNDLQVLLERDGIPCCRITGSENEFEKQQSVEDFANGKYKVALCSVKAAGVGTTLTNASNLIFNDLTWVPFDLFQAEDRVHRVGQNDDVTIYYMYCENAQIDANLAEKLERKAKEFDAVIDGGLGGEFTISLMGELYQDFKSTHGILDVLGRTSYDDSITVDELVDMALNGTTKEKSKPQPKLNAAMTALLASKQQEAKKIVEQVKPRPVEETTDPVIQLQSMFSGDLSKVSKVYRLVNLTETKTLYEVALVDKSVGIVLTYRIFTDTLYDAPISKLELVRITKNSKSQVLFNSTAHARVMNAGNTYDQITARLLIMATRQDKYKADIEKLLQAFKTNKDLLVLNPKV